MTRFFVAVICLMGFLRLVAISLSPFILDEPKLLLVLDEHFAQGRFPTLGLTGSSGSPYGPGALWMYGLVRWVSDYPEHVILLQALSVLGAFALLYYTIRKSSGRPEALWATALACSSPYLFFYSRIAMDVSFLIFFSALALAQFVMISSSPKKWAPYIGLGFAFGMLFNLHFMAIPFMTAILGGLLIQKNVRTCVFASRGAVFGISALFVVAPYIWGLLFHQSEWPRVIGNSWGETTPLQYFRDFLTSLSSAFRYLSFQGMEYFLDRDITYWILRFEPLSWFLKVFILVTLVRSLPILFRSLKSQNPPLRDLLLSVVSAATALMIVTLLLKKAQDHPHYFLACWTFVFVALVLLRTPWTRWLRIASIFLIASNLFFIGDFYHKIVMNEGTRGQHYSATLKNLRAVSDSICTKVRERDLNTVDIYLDRVTIFPPSLQYLLKHNPSCMNRVIVFREKPGTAHFVIRYSDELKESANLIALWQGKDAAGAAAPAVQWTVPEQDTEAR